MTIPRRLRTPCIALAALASFVTSGCGLAEPDIAAALVSAELIAVDGGNAHGLLRAMLVSWTRQIDVSVTGLDADTTYELTADGVAVATFVTDPDGSGNAQPSLDALRLDPRMHVFAVRLPGGEDVLVMSDPNATSGGTVLAETSPLASLVSGRATASFRASETGVRRFWVDIADVTPGAYVLWIDGTPRVTIDASSGAGVATFSSQPGPGELLLDFDPRTATIEILQGDQYCFAGTGHAEILGIDMCLRSTRRQALLAHSVGDGRASLTTRTDCGRRFAIDISGVPMGDYDVVVGGVVRASILVGEDENGATGGSVDLATNAGEGGGALAFDPLGESIEVRQGEQLFFATDAFAP